MCHRSILSFNKLKLLSSIGFIKKILYNNITPMFLKLKRQFINHFSYFSKTLCNTLYYTSTFTIVYTILSILYYTILCYTIIYYIIYTILYYIILYYTILYYTILYYIILYYTILYYTILYYAMLCYTVSVYKSRTQVRNACPNSADVLPHSSRRA